MYWQEEMQLILDESVVARFEKAGARLAASGPRGCADRRNPLWRQKHFRSEGVPYYSSVSLFRAGKMMAGVRFGAWLCFAGGPSKRAVVNCARVGAVRSLSEQVSIMRRSCGSTGM